MSQTPYRGKWRIPKNNFEEIHADIMGPFPKSVGGATYCLVLVDIKSTMCYTWALKRKSDCEDVIMKFLARIKKQHNANVLVFHDDKGGEFSSNKFDEFLSSLQIRRTQTDTATPQRNPFVERANRTLMGITRALLIQSDLPVWLWAEAVIWATHLKNIRPSSRLDLSTPWDEVYGSKPSGKHIFIFGSPVQYKNNRSKKKLSDRSLVGLYMGYDFSSHQYRVLQAGKRSVEFSRSVSVNESEILDSHGKPKIQAYLPLTKIRALPRWQMSWQLCSPHLHQFFHPPPIHHQHHQHHPYLQIQVLLLLLNPQFSNRS